MMSEDGRGGMSDAVAMGTDEAADQLDVEVHSGDGLVARGSVPVADLWTVRPWLLHAFVLPQNILLPCQACMRKCASSLGADAMHTQQPTSCQAWRPSVTATLV